MFLSKKKIIYILFYRKKHIKRKINNEIFEIEYHRLPFWTNEKPSWKLFFTEKLNYWVGQVWRVFPNGGKCGFGHISIISLCPKRYMKKYLIKESDRIYQLTKYPDGKIKTHKLDSGDVLYIPNTNKDVRVGDKFMDYSAVVIKICYAPKKWWQFWKTKKQIGCYVRWI